MNQVQVVKKDTHVYYCTHLTRLVESSFKTAVREHLLMSGNVNEWGKFVQKRIIKICRVELSTKRTDLKK